MSSGNISSSETSDAKSLISKHKYLMISKSWCPDCHYIYNLFKKLNIFNKLYIIELDKFENQKQAQLLEDEFNSIIGKKWVPQLYFNGKYWGNESNFKELVKDDKLDEELKKIGLLN
ncbi:uncharacterized protein KGF55_001612 [Candida pseudojiufengensis]|uniref:uncharacterized protein n=1 Tax=Candida pseudojiufengensis TaxID=497109 RepID=UPI00222499FA|nr:uncharacterized protein KGF55_001612 [Candida pseudojiufengensis]KAI5965391.1 hypothetical protein KGF55_001612 [Candida pseudojiufengensis]